MSLDDPTDPYDANDADDARLTVESLRTDAQRLRRWLGPRALLNALSALVAAVLVVVGGVTLLRHLRPASSAQTRTTTRVNTAAETSTTGEELPGAGWHPTGPPYAQVFAFSAANPSTAYVCGVPNLQSPTEARAVVVGAFDARGGTVLDFATPAVATQCYLSVNPTDPYDLILITEPCLTCTSLPPLALYRSRDGGMTWQQQFLPPYNARGARDFFGYQSAWSGSTFYLAPYVLGEQGYTRLAVSVAGGPLAWVRQNGLFATAPPDASINQLIGGNQAVYVTLAAGGDCQSACETMQRSTDNGASWSAFTPVANEAPIALLNASADGRTIFGQITPVTGLSRRVYLSSTDGGTTWVVLPSLPPGLAAVDFLESRDQSIYAELYTDPRTTAGTVSAAQGVYRLSIVQGTFKASNPLAWNFASPYPVRNGANLSLTWDSDGRPAALWSDADVYNDSSIQQGIQTHAP